MTLLALTAMRPLCALSPPGIAHDVVEVAADQVMI